MMAMKKVFAAALAFSLPLSALAQTTPPPETAKPAETAPAAAPAPAPAPAPAAKPAEDTIKVTPYGFVLLNMFFDGDTFTTRDYPGQVAATNAGGAVLGSARQSRFGVRLAGKDKDVTGADLSGVVEFDFKAGHLPVFTGTPPVAGPPPSTSWYNGVMRLRLAAATASWKTPYGSWSLLAGQEYGLVNPLFAESLAWVADPLFWQAGNLWRRSPQVRATFAGNFSGVGLTVAAAALSPADGFAAAAPYSTDFGPGNRSRTPDLEGRVALSYKASPDLFGTVGVGYDFGKRRLAGAVAGSVKDVDVNSLGVDADLNLMYVQVKGEWYQNKGEDDAYNGIFSPGIVGAAATGYRAVKSDGYWAQAILKPLPAIWVTAGYGVGNANKGDLAFGPAPLTTRTKNTQTEVGLLLNAGKFWRLGLEGIKTETTVRNPIGFNGTKNKDDATQIAFSSQLKF